MREIKFRAYFPGNNLIGNVTELVGSNDGYKFFKVTAECFEDGRQQFYSSSNFILLQFTGLKDKNGVEIYESDVVKIIEANRLYTVEYTDYCYKLIHVDPKLNRMTWGPINRIEELSMYVEVIGNIYQHPNLLEL